MIGSRRQKDTKGMDGWGYLWVFRYLSYSILCPFTSQKRHQEAPTGLTQGEDAFQISQLRLNVFNVTSQT